MLSRPNKTHLQVGLGPWRHSAISGLQSGEHHWEACLQVFQAVLLPSASPQEPRGLQRPNFWEPFPAPFTGGEVQPQKNRT